ncbi:MAG: ATP-binding protein [Myxococcales bacterium]|nr:ATP-binding protein [Myxococcales bacterium]
MAMSRSGRFVALRGQGTVELVDALGTAPRIPIACPDLIDFACVGSMLWLLEPGRIRRVALESGRPIEPAITVPDGGTALSAAVGDTAYNAVVLGPTPVLAHGLYDRTSCEPLAIEDARPFALHGRRVAVAAADGIHVIEAGKGELFRVLPGDGAQVLHATSLFSGQAMVCLQRGDGSDIFWVWRANGALIHRIHVPTAERWAVAESRGIGVVRNADNELVVVDLRYGRVQGEATAPMPVADLDADADGQYVVMASAPEAGALPPVLHVPFTDLFSAGAGSRRAALHAVAGGLTARPSDDDDDDDDDDDVDDDDDDDDAPRGAGPARVLTLNAPPLASVGHVLSTTVDPEVADAADAEPPPPPADLPAPPPIVVPDLLPIALGTLPQPLHVDATGDWPPYTSPREHLDELLDLVAARAAKAIADNWNSGRLSVPAEDGHPFEREVKAILGHVGGYAANLIGDADQRLAAVTARAAGRARASLARGQALPFIDLCREFNLSSTAAQILMVAVAPMARGEIARLFGILGNDENRPIVDRYLIEMVIAGDERDQRAAVAREMADEAPLFRFGLIRVGGGDRAAALFGAVTVDPVLLERIRGRPSDQSSVETSVIRSTDRTLADLHLPTEFKRDLVLALAAPRTADDPVRVVLRGRRGAGHHTAIAALARRVGRRVAAIDCHRLPRAGKLMALGLRQELFRALLRGAVPVVSGLEIADPSDAEGQDLIKQALRGHPGPVIIRAAPEASVPLDPGYVTLKVTPLTESQRAEFWRAALAEAGLYAADVDGLAARYRVGPGVISHVIAQALIRRGSEPIELDADGVDDAGPMLEEVARQHIATRLAHIATHQTRLARWEQVALPDDIHDSIREFIARIRHRKTVYEKWGFDEKMATSRGLTALFYGPPGTGKSMVAGLVARELGLDLYRVDLARIVSKWIGETEKNLAEVFDAAEDGQVVILFDEADSLFAKRTEVKSSVDRYANLEVNYLLQRLDTFEGVAVLTTNLEGSIDQAFKRRISLRLNFPFPDEDMRVRLWAAHIPTATPIAGDFDFKDLARRFPLSGGYIRNSTLRGAFLAAQENRPLAQEHLLRAIALEYREMGKLATSGRME